MKLLATKIALKWEKPLSEVTGWVRARLAFAILRTTSLCISRVKWRSAIHIDDGLDYQHQLMSRICMCYYVVHVVEYVYIFKFYLYVLCISMYIILYSLGKNM